ncbi:S-layer homology domain-containing protein [Peptoniphilus asaccharolyticus]
MNNKINRAMALMLALQMAASTATPVMAQVRSRVPMNAFNVTATTTPLITTQSQEDSEDVMSYLKRELKSLVSEGKEILQREKTEEEKVKSILNYIKIFTKANENIEEKDGGELRDAIDRLGKFIKEYKEAIGKYDQKEKEKENNKLSEIRTKIKNINEKLKSINKDDRELKNYMRRVEDIDDEDDKFSLLDTLIKGDELVKKFYTSKQEGHNTNPREEKEAEKQLKEIKGKARIDSKGQFTPYEVKVKLKFDGDTLVDIEDNGTSPVEQGSKNIWKNTFSSMKNLFENKDIKKIKSMTDKGADVVTGATISTQAFRRAIINAYEGISESLEERAENVLADNQTLTYEDYRKTENGYIYIFKSTLPKDFDVELENVTYGVEGVDTDGEYNLKKVGDKYELTIPSTSKGGLHFVNIKDKNGKYKLPEKKMVVEGIQGIYYHEWKNNTTKINYPHFINQLDNNFEYHDGKIARGDDEQIALLNKNIRLILVTTAGNSAFQIYTPQDKTGRISSNLNDFYDANGTVNKNYKAGGYVFENKGYNKLSFMDDIKSMNSRNGSARFVKVYYYGLESPSDILYPFSEYKPNDPNPTVILGSYRMPEKTLQLKIRLNDTEDKIIEVMDNNTESAGNPAYATYMAEGFKEYRDKTLAEVKNLKFESDGNGVKEQATLDVKEAVKKAVIDAMENNTQKRASYSQAKKDFKLLLNQSYKTILEIEEGALEERGVENFKAKFKKALEKFKNKNTTDVEFNNLYRELKSAKEALNRKEKDNTKLREAIDRLKKENAQDYETWSYAFLEKAILEAEEELNKHLSPKEIKEKIVKLEAVKNKLVKRIEGERKYFKISGRIAESGQEGDSMANGGFNQDIYIEEVAGKTIYHLLFKPMNIMGVKAEIQNLKHFEGNNLKETTVRVSKKAPYTKVVSFIRDKQNEELFKIQTGAYMTSANIDYRDADLKLDRSNKQTITKELVEDFIKSEVPSLGIANDKNQNDNTQNDTRTNNNNREEALKAGVYNIPFEWKRSGSEENAMGKEAFKSITAKVYGDKAVITVETKELEMNNRQGVIKGHLLDMFVKDSSSKATNETDKKSALKGEIDTTKSEFRTINNPGSKIKNYPTNFTFELPKDVINRRHEVEVRVIVDIMDILSNGEPGSGKGSRSAKLVLNPNSENLQPGTGNSNNRNDNFGNMMESKEELKMEYYKSYALSERDYDVRSWNVFKEKYHKAADMLMRGSSVSASDMKRAKEELVEARNNLIRLNRPNGQMNMNTNNSNRSNSKAYSMYVSSLEADRNEKSMADIAIVNPVTVVEENGRVYAEVRMQSVNYRGLDGEVQKLYSFEGNNRYGRKMAADRYGNTFKFEVPRDVLNRTTEVWLEVNVDIMDELMGGGYESGNRVFRMVFDPSNKQVTNDYNRNQNNNLNVNSELDREIRNAMGYNSRDYENNSWREFEYALDRARSIARDSRASSSEINRAIDDLVRAKRNLVRNNKTNTNTNVNNTLKDKKVKEDVKTYEVEVSVLRADGNGSSMAKDGVHKIARVEEKDGKFKYYVSFKPIEKQFKGKTLTGNITKLFYYDGGKNEATNEGSGVWSFTLNSKMDDVKIAVWVDAMDELRGGRPGAGEQDAILRFSWSSAKDISPKKTEEKKSTTTSDFYDVKRHWAKEAIEYGISKGYFQGVGDNSFAPNRGMTRGEFVTVLGRIQKVDKTKYQNSKFTDVNSNEFYGAYVNWATEMGIVNGTGNGKFNPNEVMTREQMAVMMANYLKVAGIGVQNGGNTTFRDSSKISSWARESVEELARAKVINGMEDGTFSPKTPFTRAQVAQVLYNIYK